MTCVCRLEPDAIGVDAARDARPGWYGRSAPCRRRGRFVAKGDHLAELPGRIDMQQREWRRSGGEGFAGEMQHDAGIFADRIEHDGTLELGGDFADDVDRLGLKGRKWEHKLMR